MSFRVSSEAPFYFLYHILVVLDLRILVCSWKIPYNNASAVGGPKLKTSVACSSFQSQSLTSRNIYIHRHNSITPPHYRIAIMIVPAAIGTASHADDPSRIRHLIVHQPQRWSHLICQSSRDYENVWLSRRATENDTKSILIVAGHWGVNHFHSTASQTKRDWPHRACTRPIDDLVQGGSRDLS